MPKKAVRRVVSRQDYFQWLCEIIHVEKGVASYWILANDLYKTEFIWTVPNDDNRAADGIGLREDYAADNLYADVSFLDRRPCSVLEMMIGLAVRVDFELTDPNKDTHDSVSNHFWEMINNLGLMMFTDERYVELNGTFNCKAIISRFLNREYKRNGEGGIFPLKKHTEVDQRKVEIWYQLMAYLDENYRF